MNIASQLVLVVVDKLFIGLLLGLAAFFVSRALERYKINQAMHTEVAKQRINKIAEVWEQLSEYNFLVEELLRSMAALLVKRHPREYENIYSGSQKRLPSISSSASVYNSAEVIEYILSKTYYIRNEDFGSEWELFISPLLDDIDAKSKGVGNTIRKNEFRLGPRLAQSCRIFESGVNDIREAFKSMDLNLIKKFFERVDDSRKDILAILYEL